MIIPHAYQVEAVKLDKCVVTYTALYKMVGQQYFIQSETF